MTAEENKQAAIRGYAAFGNGDADAALADISDSIQWVVGGDNAVTGTYTGKGEVLGFWGQLMVKGFTTNPREFVAEGDKVVVLTNSGVGGETVNNVDVLSYDSAGQLIRFETFGGDALLDRTFPR